MAGSRSKPTPAALRATRALRGRFAPVDVIEDVASVIDAQTGLPELLAALEDIAGNTGESYGAVVARAAIAKVKGGV